MVIWEFPKGETIVSIDFHKLMNSKIPFQRMLSLFFRVLFIYLFYSGILHWLYLVEFLPLNGQFFSEFSMNWKALVIFLATVDIFAAVGVWLQATWGIVIWVFRTATLIIWPLVIDSTFELSNLIIVLHIIFIVLYFILKYYAMIEIRTTVKRGLGEV